MHIAVQSVSGVPGIRSMHDDTGIEPNMQVMAAASAALAIIESEGLEQVRQLDTNHRGYREESATRRNVKFHKGKRGAKPSRSYDYRIASGRGTEIC